MSTALLSRRFSLEYSRTISNLLCNSTSLRFMGGGPRTFPGGLNKWQWKRLHEKKAREKEKKLLSQEKQLYEARIRSQIRSKLAGKSDSPAGSTQFGPITAQDQVRLLADRFMKEGAEDLWNEDDGPIGTVPSRVSNRRVRDSGFDSGKFVPNRSNSDNLADKGSDSVTGLRNFLPNRSNLANLPDHSGGSAIDLRKNVSNRRNLADNAGTSWTPLDSFRRYGNISFCRDYSVVAEKKLKIRSKFRANRCSSSDDDDGEFVPNGSKSKFSKFSLEDNLLKPSGSKSKGLGIEGKWNLRWPRFNLYESEQEDSGSTNSRGRTDLKKVASRAALGSYDLKPKRRPLQRVEEDNDSSHRVLSIRDELKMVDLSRNAVMGHQEKEESYLSKKRFDECRISPLTIKALSSAGYVQMTMVQEGSLPVCLEGKDVLVKAKTGTGKSAAFLLPAIEAVLNASNSSVNQRLPPILVLVLCPTRELASQIAAEANVLLKHHAGIGVQTLIGGTRFKDDQKRLESGPCQIIVATPGRLLDHIENKSGFSVRLMGLKVLILDEADHLLDLGFRKDIEKIVDCVPRQRQSLLFSATIPKEVRRISQLVLKRDHVFIDTVGLGGLETHTKVLQSYLAASHEIHFEIVLSILKEHIVRIVDYKVIVFCITSMVTSLLYFLLREVKMNVREMHSRKSQLYRTHISDEFRESKRLILVTSDVSARGMNYPDVTLVVQVGIPSDREQYIHRLGRTGREGKDGEGILLLAPWEEYFLDEVKDLPIQKSPLPRLDPDIKAKVETSLAKIDTSTKEAAYHSWLGYYNSIREIGRDKTMLVELANQFCNSIGLQKPPAIFRKTASKMGLRDIPGIRIRK